MDTLNEPGEAFQPNMHLVAHPVGNTRPTHVNSLAPRRSLLSNTLLCLKLTHTRRDESLAFILRLIFGCLLIWRNFGGSASLTTILLRGEAIVLWTHW